MANLTKFIACSASAAGFITELLADGNLSKKFGSTACARKPVNNYELNADIKIKKQQTWQCLTELVCVATNKG